MRHVRDCYRYRLRTLTRLAALTFTALLLQSNPTRAEWYLGAGGGETRTDLECDFNISCSSDDKDSGVKVFGGFQPGPNVAIELAYRELGETRATGMDTLFGPVNVAVAIETSVLSIATYGILPLGNVADVFGQIGLDYWDTQADVTISGSGSGSVDDTGIGVMAGLGASFNLGKMAAIRVEWERFIDVGEDENIEGFDIDMLSASFLLRFK